MVKIDPPIYGAAWLNRKSLRELKALASSLDIKGTSSMSKNELILQILDAKNPLPISPINPPGGDKLGEPKGVDSSKPNCGGYLKFHLGSGYLMGEKNIFVPPFQIANLNLKEGNFIQGIATATSEGGELILNRVISVNHKDLLASYAQSPTPVSPFERLVLTTSDPSVRAFDLFAPIGKGQRGFLLAPPKTGRTTFLKNLADAIIKGNEGIILFTLLIGEKPENISDFANVEGCNVFSTTFNQTAKEGTEVTSECFDKATDLVDTGADVVILIDGLEKVVKAFNESGNEIVSLGNISLRAIQKVEGFLSKATKYENSGSLTVISSLTARKAASDKLILKELEGNENLACTFLKPVGEMFPIFDFENTQTTKEELFIMKEQLSKMRQLRRSILELDSNEKREKVLLELFSKTSDNESLVEDFQNFEKELFSED